MTPPGAGAKLWSYPEMKKEKLNKQKKKNFIERCIVIKISWLIKD